jgi:hypothetical protein
VQDKRDWVTSTWPPAEPVDGGAGYYQPEGTKSFWIRAVVALPAARWSYSTAIETWELNNEGSRMIATLGCHERFGKYLHENSVHPHMVNHVLLSGWKPEFWGSGQYPNVDYADVHTYFTTRIWRMTPGVAVEHLSQLLQRQCAQPIMMGESGISAPGNEMFNYLTRDIMTATGSTTFCGVSLPRVRCTTPITGGWSISPRSTRNRSHAPSGCSCATWT